MTIFYVLFVLRLSIDSGSKYRNVKKKLNSFKLKKKLSPYVKKGKKM